MVAESTVIAQRKCWNKRIVAAVIAMGIIVAVALTIKHFRYHIWPKRFAPVVEGKLYRSGALERHPLEKVIQAHSLRAVLTLLNAEADDARQQMESRTLSAAGIRQIRIGMPGNGCADFDLLDQAAAVVADESNRPLLVHCAAGVHRTSATFAAWRMKYCHWSFEQAMAESAPFGVNQDDTPELWSHLRAYYNTRIAPAR